MSSPFHTKNSVLTGGASLSDPTDIYNTYEPQDTTTLLRSLGSDESSFKGTAGAGPRPPAGHRALQARPGRRWEELAAAWGRPQTSSTPQVAAQGSRPRRNTARKAKSPRRSFGQSEPAPPLGQSRAATPERRRGLERAPHVLLLGAGQAFPSRRRGACGDFPPLCSAPVAHRSPQVGPGGGAGPSKFRVVGHTARRSPTRGAVESKQRS